MYDRDEDSPRETPESRARRIRNYQQSLSPEGKMPDRRCSTGVVVANGDCEFCGAYNGEACLSPT